MADSNDDARLQEQILDLVQRSSEAVVGAGRAFTESVANVVPADTTAIEDLIDRAFDLTERILQTQRDFAKQVVQTVTKPVTDAAGSSEPSD